MSNSNGELQKPLRLFTKVSYKKQKQKMIENKINETCDMMYTYIQILNIR